MALDPTLESLIRRRFESSAFAKWMGISLIRIGDGQSELRLDLEPHHLNPGGIVHGGVLATLLDACIGLALRTRLDMGSNHVTAQLDVRYLAPARGGLLLGRGHALKVGPRLSFGEAELATEEGSLVSKGSATFLVVPAKGAGEPARPGAAGATRL